MQHSPLHLLVVLLLVLISNKPDLADGAWAKYRKTCPEKDHPLCSPYNRCDKCHSSCQLCQNLDKDYCGPDDCMACKPPQVLRLKYTDGTGPCVPANEAYLATCPPTNPACKPGNRCLACDASCGFCFSETSILCGPQDCVTCNHGRILMHNSHESKTGTCIVPKIGFKNTCPASHIGCKETNQCLKCPKGCLYCQSTSRALCGVDDCMECNVYYTLVKKSEGSAKGKCVAENGQRDSITVMLDSLGTEHTITRQEFEEWGVPIATAYFFIFLVLARVVQVITWSLTVVDVGVGL